MAKQRWTVEVSERGVRLDKFLADAGRLRSRSRATAAIDRGKVFVNGAEAATADAARTLAEREVVEVWLDRPGTARPVRARRRRDGDLVIVYEDASLLVVDKPAGLLAVPLGGRGERQSLVDLIARHLRSQGKRQPHVVHRIDRDTSGLVLFAKDGPTLAHLKRQFLKREPERIYLAIVHGHVRPASGTWRDRLKWDGEELMQRAVTVADPRGTDAISTYRVVERLDGASLLEVRLQTGKRNQIRVQSDLRGHPLLGEKQYNRQEPAQPIAFPRQALHAWKLSFTHPVTGRIVRLEAPMPADMRALLTRLSKPAGD